MIALDTDRWLHRLTEVGLDAPRRTRIASTPLGPADARRRVEALPEALDCWLCFTGVIWYCRDGEWRRAGRGDDHRRRWDRLLSGEVRLSERESLHLRHGHDGLRAWLYREVEEGGDAALMYHTTVMSTEAMPQTTPQASRRQLRLAYEVAWTQRPDPSVCGPADTPLDVRPWRPTLARFAGWRSQ